MQSCEEANASKLFNRSEASKQKLHVTAGGGGNTAPEVVQSVLKPRHVSKEMRGTQRVLFGSCFAVAVFAVDCEQHVGEGRFLASAGF